MDSLDLIDNYNRCIFDYQSYINMLDSNISNTSNNISNLIKKKNSFTKNKNKIDSAIKKNKYYKKKLQAYIKKILLQENKLAKLYEVRMAASNKFSNLINSEHMVNFANELDFLNKSINVPEIIKVSIYVGIMKWILKIISQIITGYVFLNVLITLYPAHLLPHIFYFIMTRTWNYSRKANDSILVGTKYEYLLKILPTSNILILDCILNLLYMIIFGKFNIICGYFLIWINITSMISILGLKIFNKTTNYLFDMDRCFYFIKTINNNLHDTILEKLGNIMIYFEKNIKNIVEDIVQ